MLIYHPAYDAYHCVFRSVLLIDGLGSVEIDKLRILDFFYCFPSEISRIRLPKEQSAGKKLAQALSNPYHGPVNFQQTFRDLEHIQLAAYRTLVGSQLIRADDFDMGILRRTDVTLPADLLAHLARAREQDKALLDYLTNKLSAVPLLGENGLKHRTRLMEHRYDVV